MTVPGALPFRFHRHGFYELIYYLNQSIASINVAPEISRLLKQNALFINTLTPIFRHAEIWGALRQFCSGQKWISAPLIAEGGHRAVSGDESNLIAQGEQLLTDGGNQGVQIAAREIGAPDRAAK